MFSVYVVLPAALIAGMIRIGRTLVGTARREPRGNRSRWRSLFARPARTTAPPRARQDATATLVVAMVLWIAGAIALLALGSGGQGGALLVAFLGVGVLGLYGLIPSPNWRIALPVVGIAWASMYLTLGAYFIPGLLALLVGALRAEAAPSRAAAALRAPEPVL